MATKYVITGINRLTMRRETLSHPMAKEHAEMRLHDVKVNMRYKHHQPYQRLKLEPWYGLQLKLKF